MKRHLLIPAAVGSVLLLSSCLDSDSSGDSVDENSSGEGIGSAESPEEMSFPEALKLKRNLAREAEKLEERLANAEEIQKEQRTAAGELAAISEYRRQLNETDRRVEASLDFWRNATRESFVGVQLPEITTNTGEVF